MKNHELSVNATVERGAKVMAMVGTLDVKRHDHQAGREHALACY